ncbi:MAG: oligosaccharide flippase family protein [Isosphaeraceae bacterium]
MVKLLWLQAVTAPCYGLSVVVSSVLQAARRYDFIPRLELGVILGRFVVLYVGVNAGFDFFHVVATQTAVQIGMALLPALWVMVRELGYAPRFRGALASDYKSLLHISFFVFLLQLSVVLADKVDKIVLGVALSAPGSPADPAAAIAVYDVVSKPFLQVRQSGWMLAYFVMPAVASLVAARDVRGLERVKYDGTRLHLSAILPVGLLAFVYAAPFLTLWVGDRLEYDAAREAPLVRLFLVAAIPLILSVPVQTGLGMNRVAVVAVSALAGALVNLPISYVLTQRMGVAGVIWGTVLTTLFSNLLVPGVYLFRVLEIDPWRFLSRTLAPLAAGGVGLLVVAGVLNLVWPLSPTPAHGVSPPSRWLPLVIQLSLCCLAYAACYLATPTGRRDAHEILTKLRLRRS